MPARKRCGGKYLLLRLQAPVSPVLIPVGSASRQRSVPDPEAKHGEGRQRDRSKEKTQSQLNDRLQEQGHECFFPGGMVKGPVQRLRALHLPSSGCRQYRKNQHKSIDPASGGIGDGAVASIVGS